MRVLVGVTGSVAATITPKLVTKLLENDHEVQLVYTKAASYFFDSVKLPQVTYWCDQDEWSNGRYEKNQKIPHIELRKWADCIVLAPLSANTLGKLANGLADNLLTCIMRAWDISKPVLLAPAMNTLMWQHPATHTHLQQLQQWYQHCIILQPVAKKLACGDEGVGAMTDVKTICQALTNINGR